MFFFFLYTVKLVVFTTLIIFFFALNHESSSKLKRSHENSQGKVYESRFYISVNLICREIVQRVRIGILRKFCHTEFTRFTIPFYKGRRLSCSLTYFHVFVSDSKLNPLDLNLSDETGHPRDLEPSIVSFRGIRQEIFN